MGKIPTYSWSKLDGNNVRTIKGYILAVTAMEGTLMDIYGSGNSNFMSKKNAKVIDTVILNGKYVDASVFRKKILSATFAIAAILCVGVIVFL